MSKRVVRIFFLMIFLGMVACSSTPSHVDVVPTKEPENENLRPTSEPDVEGTISKYVSSLRVLLETHTKIWDQAFILNECLISKGEIPREIGPRPGPEEVLELKNFEAQLRESNPTLNVMKKLLEDALVQEELLLRSLEIQKEQTQNGCYGISLGEEV